MDKISRVHRTLPDAYLLRGGGVFVWMRRGDLQWCGAFVQVEQIQTSAGGAIRKHRPVTQVRYCVPTAETRLQAYLAR